MKQITILLTSIALMVTLSGVVSAQEQPTTMQVTIACIDKSVFIKKARKMYDERPVIQGIVHTKKHLMHIWKSPDGGTWTVTLASPSNNQICMLTNGTDLVPLKLKKKPADPA